MEGQGAWPNALLLVGCGNMGGAMLAGWLAAGLSPERFTVLDPIAAEPAPGVILARDSSELAERRFDALLLAVKPQLLGAVAPTVSRLASGDTLVLSIMAGVDLGALDRLFPASAGAVRIMPNLAAALGKSPMALAAGALGPDRRAAVTALMAPLGAAEWIDERLFDAVTALAGSGPAFVYRFIAALADGGVALGLPADQAERLARATVEGAAMLAARSSEPPDALARKVASAGGTTQAGLEVLDDGGKFGAIIAATLAAAARRGAELAAQAGG